MKSPTLPILVALFALASFAAVVLSAGCSTGGDLDARPARAPLIGTAAAGAPVDVADRACKVVLRRADHVVDARGQGVVATVDVDQQFLKYPGQTPGVLFRADGSDWQAVTAAPADGAPAGFTRFVARFLVAQSADFIAFDPTSTDLRLFDHNRLPGDFDSFHVDAANGFAVAEAPAVCPGLPPEATLDFQVGWHEQQHGAIVAGGRVEIDYALERLATCRATHNGYRFWTLDAYARFSPGGQTVTGTVVGSNGPTVYPQPFVADVPADATGVQLWFRNASPDGCEAWDSNYGHNYAFDVVPAPLGPVGWAGNLGGSTSRDCQHHDGLADPLVIDEYARERACLYVDGDVWVGGVTDGEAPHPAYVDAQVEWQKDSAAGPTWGWLDDVGRAGNNERFRWQLPYELRNQADWTKATYRLRFSTDGHTWYYPEGGATRTIERAFTLPSG